MWIGNLMLVLLNLPLIGLWVKLLTVPYHVLFPAIIAFCSIGVYASTPTSSTSTPIAVLRPASATCWSSCGCEPAPLLLGFVLGPLLEENLRRAMILSRGDPTIFVDAPDPRRRCSPSRWPRSSSPCLPAVRKKRDEVFVEED